MMRSEAAVLERVAADPPSVAGAMGKTDQKRTGEQSSVIDPKGEGVDKAFDLWLRRGLHQLYDTVAKEPIPENLLRMIEEDRASHEEE